jgi:hypothetical protein
VGVGVGGATHLNCGVCRLHPMITTTTTIIHGGVLTTMVQEKQQQYKRLNPAERVIYRGGQLFFKNTYTRMFLLGYSVLLHSLVFLVLYKLTTVTSCTTSTEHD